MARQILPIAGQIIGGMIGGPVGAAIGGAIGSAVGQYVDPLRHQGPKLGEARAQTAQEGVYRPLVFGTGCVAGNVIHRSPRKVVVHRESAGGKGNRDTVDSERGYRTFAIRIAEAHTPEGYQLLRIWENETLVYDVRPESEIPAESAEYAEKFRFYPGTQDQLPDPDLEAYMGVGNVNAYRGSCYIVFGNFDLTDYGDMVPQYRFEIASSSNMSGASGVYAFNTISGLDSILQVSYDGINFENSIDTGLAGRIDSLHSSGGRVYVFSGVSYGRTTRDGITWEDVTGIGGALHVRDVTYSDGVWVIVYRVGGVISRSVDGVNFVSISVPERGRYCAASSGSTFLLGGTGGAITASFDGGISWGEYGVGASEPDTGDSSLNSIVHTGSVFIATRGGMFWRSVDGTEGSWDNFHTIYGSGPGHSSGVHGNMVLVGNNDRMFVSYDGGLSFELGEAKGLGNVTAQPKIPGNSFGFFIGSISSSGGVCFKTTDGIIWHDTFPVFPGGRASIVTAEDHTIPSGFGLPIPLKSVIGWCHSRVGQPVSDFDVSELDDELDGVVFADGYTARDAITTLLPIYNADASEHDRGSGYRINYIKRGAPVVRTLTVDDLVDEPEETVREDPMERPRVLHMAFESPITGYTAGKASIQRLSPDVKLVNEVSTYVPVTFKEVDEAWQRADVQMRVAWTEVHGERKFSISDAHIDLVPTDNVGLFLRGQLQRLRLLKNEYADGVMKLESVADRQSNYTSHVTGIPLPAPEKPPPSLMGPAALAILDIPAISDQHDRLGWYVGVCGTTDAYAGVVIQRQQNGEWADVVGLGRSQRTTMGVLESTVTAGSQHYTDTTNTVSVSLYMDDELESLSDAQWLNKGGAFALETAAGWEIMQYRDAYQDSGGVWHLTHLARGRLNTVADEHLPGARFVMLDRVQFIDATVGMISQPLTLRAAAVGRSPETAVSETITYQGNSQREFPLAHLLSDGIDGGEITVQMIPRHRFGTEDHPVRSVNWEGYRVHASVVVAQQTVDTISDTQTFTVPGPANGIEITVGQLNRYTGQGPTTSETYLK